MDGYKRSRNGFATQYPSGPLGDSEAEENEPLEEQIILRYLNGPVFSCKLLDSLFVDPIIIANTLRNLKL